MSRRLAVVVALAACRSATRPAPPPPEPVAPDPACASDGCLRAAEHVGDYAASALAAVLSPGASVDNGYSIDTLTFFTDGAVARATVATPLGAAPPGGWHVVANAHGTTGIDDPCAVAGTIAGAGLAGTFGGHGLVGVAVDYPGLGTDGIHPYLVADSEGHAVLDAVRATEAWARWRGVALSGRVAVVGLSQGGHAALAAAARHRAYAPELDLRAVAVAAPANVFEEQWRLGAVDGPLIAVHAMLFYAWADHYGYRGPSLWTAATAAHIDDDMHQACTWSPIGAPALADRLGTRADQIFSADFLAAYRGGDWGPFATLGDAFRDNRIGPYVQTAPLLVYQGDADEVVPAWATRALVDALRAGGDEVDYQVVPGGTHDDVAFGFVANHELRTDEALAWLRARLAD